ncbi:hypothetical protein L2E82_36141 [Cichorium intybus]|uniref:Uncharacterized protein n=1 Tax=Cichorium intybus TaxID=13427 RepID=A0ACB9BQQ6_CICIN|nr:hypothetical protein L2E82_36141 [Cichorium intybus]
MVYNSGITRNQRDVCEQESPEITGVIDLDYVIVFSTGVVFVSSGETVEPGNDPPQKLRLNVAYDSSIPEHQQALRVLWRAAFPEEELHGLISEQWKEMGWQGKDPSTDFR